MSSRVILVPPRSMNRTSFIRLLLALPAVLLLSRKEEEESIREVPAREWTRRYQSPYAVYGEGVSDQVRQLQYQIHLNRFYRKQGLFSHEVYEQEWLDAERKTIKRLMDVGAR